MKKLFTLFLALIASVGTTFAARDVVPSDAVLKNYYKTGQLCVCIFVPAEMACNDVVFVGTYNNWDNSDVKALAKFEPVEGYEGWYVIAVNDETPADFENGKGIQGKPVVLDQDGNFNAELYMRVIVKDQLPYWYVGFASGNEQLKALLVDGINGEVLAIREIF